MKKLIVLFLVTFSVSVFCADQDTNRHEFSWKAVSKKTGMMYTGHGETNMVGKVFGNAQRELDWMARNGSVEKEEEFVVSTRWKDKDFEIILTAHATYAIELSRGPDKMRELPRGPIKQLRTP